MRVRFRLIAVMIGASQIMTSALAAQTTGQSVRQTTSSVSGAVYDADTGEPLPDVRVAIGKASAITNSAGKYALSGIAPAQYSIGASTTASGTYTEQTITVYPGRDLTRIDLKLQRPARISGTVRDRNDEPVVGAQVFLLAKEYAAGQVAYCIKAEVLTNDRGDYLLTGVRADRLYVVLASPHADTPLDADSNIPRDLKRRREINTPTFYPNTPVIDAAQPLTVRSGERKEHIDLKLLRSPSYCAEASVLVDGKPAPVRVLLSDRQPSLRPSPLQIWPPEGRATTEGNIRICDLHPGDYNLEVYGPNPEQSRADYYRRLLVTIFDHDVSSFRIDAEHAVAVPAEVSWSDAKTEQRARAFLQMKPLSRPRFWGEAGISPQCDVPCKLTIERALVDDYIFNVVVFPAGEPQPGSDKNHVYVKDISYCNQSILGAPLHIAPGGELKITLATDGAIVRGTVRDKDSQPVPNINVYLFPDGLSSEEKLAADLNSMQTDQDGAYISKVVAPGKYRVLATAGPLHDTPEGISKLWSAFSAAKEVVLDPGATPTLDLITWTPAQ